MIESLSDCDALVNKCKSSNSKEDLADSVDQIEQFIGSIETRILAEKKVLDETRHTLETSKLEKKSAEAKRDSVKRMLSNLKSDIYNSRSSNS